MSNTPERDKPFDQPTVSSAGSGMCEEVTPFQYATSADQTEQVERELYAGLDNPVFHPTVEQIRRDLLEAREDIRAGRACSVDDVLSAIDEAFEQGVMRRRRQNGDPVV
jgi:hypothetical protein